MELSKEIRSIFSFKRDGVIRQKNEVGEGIIAFFLGQETSIHFALSFHAQVVQRLRSVIHWIYHYPCNKYHKTYPQCYPTFELLPPCQANKWYQRDTIQGIQPFDKPDSHQQKPDYQYSKLLRKTRISFA